jgi:hypothetical protein
MCLLGNKQRQFVARAYRRDFIAGRNFMRNARKTLRLPGFMRDKRNKLIKSSPFVAAN